MLLSPQDLSLRWGKSETAIRLASAVGVGPRFIKTDGQIRYAMEEVRQYEQVCLCLRSPDADQPTVH